VASIAELAHGEKSCTQSLNHPAYLMPGNRSPCTSEQMSITDTHSCL